MPRTIALLLVAASIAASSAHAQWKKIADFIGPDGSGEYITCVYFLDLPGPPRIGFVGTASQLYKTVNGGKSWTRSWGQRDYDLYWPTDIYFKDSLTGWFSMYGDTDACYRTTDGGTTWKEVYSSPFGGAGIYYSQSTGRLFLSLENDVKTGIRLSTDLGDTWHLVTDTESAGIVFSNGIYGVASAFTPFSDTSSALDTSYGIFYTNNGGLSWHYIHLPEPKQSFGFLKPLAIMGTPICFVASMGEVTVWRSDDYGEHWRKVADLGPFMDSNYHSIGPYGMGYIMGGLNRLSIQTDSGMYLSLDSGVTWKNDGGPAEASSVHSDRFYSAKGVTIAGMTYDTGWILLSGGLWEEDWGDAGVAESAVPPSPSEISLSLARSILTVTSVGSMSSVVVFDVLGRLLASTQVREANTANLDVGGTPPGVYFVRITLAQAPTLGEVRTIKLVKE